MVLNRNLKFSLVCLYRAPQNKVNLFLDKLESLLQQVTRNNQSALICGDWNINFLDVDDPKVNILRNTFASFNLKELVQQPTRITPDSKSLLDNVVTNISSEHMSCDSFFSSLSDHDAQLISIKTNFVKPVEYVTFMNT